MTDLQDLYESPPSVEHSDLNRSRSSAKTGMAVLKWLLYMHCLMAMMTLGLVRLDCQWGWDLMEAVPLVTFLFGVITFVSFVTMFTPLLILFTWSKWRPPLWPTLPILVCDVVLTAVHFQWFMFLC